MKQTRKNKRVLRLQSKEKPAVRLPSRRESALNGSFKAQLRPTGPIKQSIVTFADLSATALTFAGAVKNMQLDRVTGFAKFTGLYDEFRVAGWKLTWLPRVNVHSLTTSAVVTTAQMTAMVSAIDPDDTAVPASFDDILEFPTSKVTAGYEKHVVQRFVPRPSFAAFGGTFTQFADPADPKSWWFDCASDDTEFYGIKYGSIGGGNGQTTLQVWDLWEEVWLEFRSVHN